MEIMYSTSAIATGGRAGKVMVENSPLVFEMSPPIEMGGKKADGVNPEQLFAAGYAACFGSALQHVVRTKKLAIPVPTVKLTVGMGKNDTGGFALAVNILATFKDILLAEAEALVQEAHQVCPYSNATRGNIAVVLAAEVN